MENVKLGPCFDSAFATGITDHDLAWSLAFTYETWPKGTSSMHCFECFLSFISGAAYHPSFGNCLSVFACRTFFARSLLSPPFAD
jgi:hypothetical protein